MTRTAQDDGDAEFAELIGSIALTPIATVVTDPRLPDNPIVAVNAAFEQLTGYNADEVIGRNCRLLAGKDTSSEQRTRLREAIARSAPVLAEMINYRKDGSAFCNAVMIAPIVGSEGEVRYFVGSQMEVPAGAHQARRSEAAARIAGLTRRQRQVLENMVTGQRNKQIAATLGIDEKTVKMHRAAMLERLGCATSADAIRTGVEAGLGDGQPGPS